MKIEIVTRALVAVFLMTNFSAVARENEQINQILKADNIYVIHSENSYEELVQRQIKIANFFIVECLKGDKSRKEILLPYSYAAGSKNKLYYEVESRDKRIKYPASRGILPLSSDKSTVYLIRQTSEGKHGTVKYPISLIKKQLEK